MEEDINDLIINALEKDKSRKNIKEFLNILMNIELKHFREAKWHYSDDYEIQLNKKLENKD